MILHLVVFAGCSDPPTQLVVSVCTDFDPAAVAALRVEVIDADAPPAAIGEEHRWEGSELPLSFGVAGRPGREVRLHLELVDIDGNVLVDRLVQTGFEEGVAVPVTVKLAAVCETTNCPATTCGSAGECVEVRVPVESWASRVGECEAIGVVDGSAPDGDAGMPTDLGDAGRRCDEDDDGVDGEQCGGFDCDDSDATRYPDAAELCNGTDDDCDGRTDEEQSNRFYRDADGDEYGRDDDFVDVDACTPPDGYVARGGDCVDTDSAQHPGASELCDRVDNDCSSGGGPDPAEDADDDGYAPPDLCTGGPLMGGDCRDDDPSVNPGAIEFCSGVDEDCDGSVDEAGADTCSPDATCIDGCVVDERLAVGDQVACLASDSDVRCWGRSEEVGGGHAGPLGVVGSEVWAEPRELLGAGATEVALGSQHGCVRLVDGTSRCWGSNRSGQLGVGDTLPHSGVVEPSGISGSVIQVAVGDRFSCALTHAGHVYCWGKNEGGELGLGDFVDRSAPTRLPLERVVELRAGGVNACARDAEGVLRCWGASTVGSGAGFSNSPVEVAGMVEEVAMGGRYLGGGFFTGEVVACARSSSGWSCWGYTTTGATGTGVLGEVAEPQPLTAIDGAVLLGPGAQRSCAIQGDGRVRCWGTPMLGLLGTPSDGPPSLGGVEITRDEDATDLACGLAACCLLAPGPRVSCWGDPLSAVHGDGYARDGSDDAPLALSGIVDLSIGADHACAVSGSETYCWGRGGSALGIGDAYRRFEPSVVSLTATRVELSGDRSCALSSSGQIHCWGASYAGDTAETSGADQPTLVDASAMGAATDVATANAYTCALDVDGAPWCWGGSGSTSPTINRLCGAPAPCPTPTAILTAQRFVEIDAGDLHVCARKSDGTVWCWGAGSSGRLGRDDSSWVNEPIQVPGIGDAVELAMQGRGGCVRHSTGRVSCWGRAAEGQTGDGGGGAPRTAPVEVAGLTDALTLECGEGCLARSASRGWLGWGRNTSGTLGDGSRTNQLTPVPSAHGRAFDSIAMGSNTSCGVAADGSARCWGGQGTAADDALGYSVFSDVAL